MFTEPALVRRRSRKSKAEGKKEKKTRYRVLEAKVEELGKRI
jgi:hypothetical protein